MWITIPSLAQTVETLAPAFTQPSFATHSSFLLAWVVNLGRRNLRRVAENTRPEVLPDHSRRHDADPYYNFLERSAWTPKELAYRLGVLVFTTLKFLGPIPLVVDDTLAHKRGHSVWGLGWWRDAVASTKKRVATASGHNWGVVARPDPGLPPAVASAPARSGPPPLRRAGSGNGRRDLRLVWRPNVRPGRGRGVRL